MTPAELRAQIAALEEEGQRACHLYCQWYDSGLPRMDGAAMAYELVSCCRQILNRLAALGRALENWELPDAADDEYFRSGTRYPGQ